MSVPGSGARSLLTAELFAQLPLGLLEQCPDVAIDGQIVDGGRFGARAGPGVGHMLGMFDDFPFGLAFEHMHRVLYAGGGGFVRMGTLPLAGRAGGVGQQSEVNPSSD